MQRVRMGGIGLSVLLVAAACTSDAASTTTLPAPVAPTTTTSLPSATVAMPTFPDDAEQIAIDPDVTIGVLDNGLTYYVRRNTRPGTRAQLRLVVTAGSAAEDPDQRGVAHYLEHMLFNGTEAFPANELIRVLERFGAEFGPDINAYTNFDETVYELEVPTTGEGNLETAFDVLFEWSSKATIDAGEVAAERGVLLEEWRLRSQNFFGRYFDEVSGVLLAGSPYEGHDPLADEAELNATTAATLRRFYEDWYRPELMAVVAVGDIDVGEVEQLIRERFGGSVNPADGRPRPDLGTGPATEPGFVILPDPESPNAFVELNYPLPATEQGTVGTIRQELALGLAFDMLVTRLDEDSRRGDVPFFNPSFAANPFVNGQRTPGLAAMSEPVDLEATARALLEEVRRAVIHGFGADELARAVADGRARADLALSSVRSKQDREYAEEYVAHFTTGFPIPPAETRHELTVRLLEEMTPGQVADTFRATIQSTQPLVIVSGPASAAESLPDEESLRDLVATAAAAEVAAREDTGVTAEQLMESPDPVEIVARRPLSPLRPTVLELANGATVVYVESDIAAGSVSFQAVSPGGWLLVPPEDAVEAQLVGGIVLESGVAELDQVALSRFLSGEVVEVVTFIDETREVMTGSAETRDLQLLFQLIHLYFTQPRADEQALSSLVGELRPLATDRGALPSLAIADRLSASRYRGDARYLAVPTVDDLDTFDLSRAESIYRERFADASDFVFAFAGDFEAAELEDLAARFLGTLPAAGVRETAGTGQPAAPSGIVRETVESGDGSFGATTYQLTEEIGLTSSLRLTVPLLESIVDQRLTALLREELGATYSPFVQFSMQDEPVELIEVVVQVSGDPDGLERIADSLEADLTDLSAAGPTADEFEIAVQQTLADYALIDNLFWLDTMTRYVLNPDLDPGEVARREDLTRAITRADVQSLAQQLLSLDEYIRVDLVPAR